MQLREAAETLGVHYQTAYGWVREGVLPARKVGRGYEVSDEDVRALRARRDLGREPAREVRVRDWRRPGRPAVRGHRRRRGDPGPVRAGAAGRQRAAGRPVPAGHRARAAPHRRRLGRGPGLDRAGAPGQRHLRAADRGARAAARPAAGHRGGDHAAGRAARPARADGRGVPARGPLARPSPGRRPAGGRDRRAGQPGRRRPGRAVVHHRPGRRAGRRVAAEITSVADGPPTARRCSPAGRGAACSTCSGRPATCAPSPPERGTDHERGRREGTQSHGHVRGHHHLGPLGRRHLRLPGRRSATRRAGIPACSTPSRSAPGRSRSGTRFRLTVPFLGRRLALVYRVTRLDPGREVMLPPAAAACCWPPTGSPSARPASGPSSGTRPRSGCAARCGCSTRCWPRLPGGRRPGRRRPAIRAGRRPGRPPRPAA